MQLFAAVLACFLAVGVGANEDHDDYSRLFAPFSQEQRRGAAAKTREMFDFAYGSYMKYAFPEDELDPIHCRGRGPDLEHPENININDVLGNYSLGLVDALTALAVLEKTSPTKERRFHEAVRLVSRHVRFDSDVTVQVFEATIRVLGGLLSAHLLLTDESGAWRHLRMEDYDGRLLELAAELGARLLPAIERSPTGLPYARVQLGAGDLPRNTVHTTSTCTAGAGSLVVELGTLSRLLGDPTYEAAARRAVEEIWRRRFHETGLFGNDLDVETGDWRGFQSGLGAGIDSYFEYLLKAHILFGRKSDERKFRAAYEAIQRKMRIGRPNCLDGDANDVPLYVNVDARNGNIINRWIDSLQAAWPGVAVLAGDVAEAICLHAVYFALWRRFGVLPERWNWQTKDADVRFYPLRPELAESTYLLYRATREPFYLHAGLHMLQSLENRTRTKCGFATVHDVNDGSLEDRMESFFMSETLKYLYLLFDETNPVNRNYERMLFTTEGHIFPVDARMRNSHVDAWLPEDDNTEEVEQDRAEPTKAEPTTDPDQEEDDDYDDDDEKEDDAGVTAQCGAAQPQLQLIIRQNGQKGVCEAPRFPFPRRKEDDDVEEQGQEEEEGATTTQIFHVRLDENGQLSLVDSRDDGKTLDAPSSILARIRETLMQAVEKLGVKQTNAMEEMDGKSNMRGRTDKRLARNATCRGMDKNLKGRITGKERHFMSREIFQGIEQFVAGRK